MFKAVGSPKTAVRLLLKPSEKAYLNCNILALNTSHPKIHRTQAGPLDVVLATGMDPITLEVDGWTIGKQFIASSIKTQSVISAPGGIYRVDVPVGQQFKASPSALIGYTKQPRNIYEENRMDLFWSWVGLARNGLASIYRSTRDLAARASRKIRKPSPTPELDLPQTTDMPYAVYWQRIKVLSSRKYGAVSQLWFDWTHPRKLEFTGPCSILIKGRN